MEQEILGSQPEWGFENESDKAMGIVTKTYENGRQVKRVTLSSGKVAVMRELNGKEMEQSSRLHENKEEKVTMALCVYSTKIDDKPILLEELEEMRAKDYTKIKAGVTALNF